MTLFTNIIENLDSQSPEQESVFLESVGDASGVSLQNHRPFLYESDDFGKFGMLQASEIFVEESEESGAIAELSLTDFMSAFYVADGFCANWQYVNSIFLKEFQQDSFQVKEFSIEEFEGKDTLTSQEMEVNIDFNSLYTAEATLGETTAQELSAQGIDVHAQLERGGDQTKQSSLTFDSVYVEGLVGQATGISVDDLSVKTYDNVAQISVDSLFVEGYGDEEQEISKEDLSVTLSLDSDSPNLGVDFYLGPLPDMVAKGSPQIVETLVKSADVLTSVGAENDTLAGEIQVNKSPVGLLLEEFETYSEFSEASEFFSSEESNISISEEQWNNVQELSMDSFAPLLNEEGDVEKLKDLVTLEFDLSSFPAEVLLPSLEFAKKVNQSVEDRFGLTADKAWDNVLKDPAGEVIAGNPGDEAGEGGVVETVPNSFVFGFMNGFTFSELSHALFGENGAFPQQGEGDSFPDSILGDIAQDYTDVFGMPSFPDAAVSNDVVA